MFSMKYSESIIFDVSVHQRTTSVLPKRSRGARSELGASHCYWLRFFIFIIFFFLNVLLLFIYVCFVSADLERCAFLGWLCAASLVHNHSFASNSKYFASTLLTPGASEQSLPFWFGHLSTLLLPVAGRCFETHQSRYLYEE